MVDDRSAPTGSQRERPVHHHRPPPPPPPPTQKPKDSHQSNRHQGSNNHRRRFVRYDIHRPGPSLGLGKNLHHPEENQRHAEENLHEPEYHDQPVSIEAEDFTLEQMAEAMLEVAFPKLKEALRKALRKKEGFKQENINQIVNLNIVDGEFNWEVTTELGDE